MVELFGAVALFLFFHLLPAIRPLRTSLISRIGRPAYFTIFSAISIAVTIWLFIAYLNAPYIEIWTYQPWTRWVVLTIMPLSCILIVVGLSSPNPFSLSLTTSPFDPATPGLTAWIRHPAIWGLGLWSAVHMVPNGDAASLTMFGLLTLLSTTGPRTLERRRRSAMADTAWQTLISELKRPSVLETVFQVGALRILGGLALYVTLLYLHESVIGVSPLPG